MGSRGAFGVTPHDSADIAFVLSSPCSVVQHHLHLNDIQVLYKHVLFYSSIWIQTMVQHTQDTQHQFLLQCYSANHLSKELPGSSWFQSIFICISSIKKV